MVSAISNATPSQPVSAPAKASAPKAAQPEAKAAPTVDTVQLSAAAQATSAALKEAMETPAQTAKEASGGDPQAVRLLASEAAAKVAAK